MVVGPSGWGQAALTVEILLEISVARYYRVEAFTGHFVDYCLTFYIGSSCYVSIVMYIATLEALVLLFSMFFLCL